MLKVKLFRKFYNDPTEILYKSLPQKDLYSSRTFAKFSPLLIDAMT